MARRKDLLLNPLVGLMLFGGALFFLSGCRKQDDIETYTVARPHPHQPAASSSGNAKDEGVPGQLIGAIIPQGQMTWFFKLTGRIEAVQTQAEPFLKFISSIRFTDKGPEWTLPEGWERQPGSEMRFATLKIASDGKPLEMSVIPLPTAPGSLDAYVLSNVNRWREQMQLEPISPAELPEKVVKISLHDSSAWIVNCVGHLKDQPMGGAPFARPSEPRRESPPGGSGQGSLPFDCQIPEGWQPAQANSMQLAAYEVRADGQEAAISVSTAGGDLVANINRWREQIHLPLLGTAELKQSLRPISVDGHEGVLAELTGPESDPKPQLLLGVIVEAQGKQWFIKMRGDAGLAAREKGHFEQFVQSIRFRGGK